jgi:tRNA pseudouridine38-40 synthase
MKTLCAGRTDAGVQALNQVVHVDTDLERDSSSWIRGTNRFLPADIAVQWCVPVAGDFHARNSARGRRYTYWLLEAPVRPAIEAGAAGWTFRPLDARRMEAAAALLVGEHDFSAFRAVECQAKSPVRNVERLSVTRGEEWVVIDVTANAFLHHMVRNVAGLLMSVGSGDSPPERVATVLAVRDRKANAATAPPDGLYLAAVRYPAEFGLPVPKSAIIARTLTP